MDPILKLAKKHELLIVEDAACGFGSKYKSQHVGTFGDTGCFSFHPRKAITTGEGGMITASNESLVEKIRRLRDHGASKSDLQRHLGPRPYLLADHPDAGYNQRMTDLQGALGSAQMNRANDIVLQRQTLAERYDEAFEGLGCLQRPFKHRDYEHGYQSYPCLFMPSEVNPNSIAEINFKRNRWMDDLQKAGISTRPATHAVHMLKFYKEKYNINPEDMPFAMAANDLSFSIPLYNGLNKEEIKYVVKTIRNYY